MSPKKLPEVNVPHTHGPDAHPDAHGEHGHGAHGSHSHSHTAGHDHDHIGSASGKLLGFAFVLTASFSVGDGALIDGHPRWPMTELLTDAAALAMLGATQIAHVREHVARWLSSLGVSGNVRERRRAAVHIAWTLRPYIDSSKPAVERRNHRVDRLCGCW